MKIPAKVRVGPYDIVITTLDKSNKDFGQFSSTDMEIRLCQKFATQQIAADTFLHELLHAVWFVAGLRSKDDEERVVATMATGIAQVIRDNPDAVDWLRGALK